MHPDRLPDLLARLDRRAAALAARSLRYSRLRLATALGGLVLALVLGRAVSPEAGWGAFFAAAAVFVGLVRGHERVARAERRLGLWRTLQARHLARLRLDWGALGPAPEAAPPAHPFASDLDVTGPRSLIHLLDSTGTEGGSARLRAWLLAADPDPEAARLRQRRVRALVPRGRLRDRLALLAHEASGDADARWDDGAIHAWLAAPAPGPSLGRWAVVLTTLDVLTLSLFVVWALGGPSLWLYSFTAYAVLYLYKFGAFAHVFERAQDLQLGLARVGPLLRFAERDGARLDPALEPVWRPLAGARGPRQRLRRLDRITAAAALTRNDVLRLVFNVLLPYDLLIAIALSRLRTELASLLPPWLDALYEIEALGALAGAHALRPQATTFPDLLPPEASGEGALLEARDLRHPLLPLDGARGNDVALGTGEVVVVTGSNMSGKSTFLRAIGLGSVLGWAGGPVWAGALALQPLRPFASMRIGDVLQEGLSTFYAEVRRLKALLDWVEAPPAPEGSGAAAPPEAAPALVLIDEMLRGTNNRERLAGAQAIVRALAGARATGLVATHDLALADLEGEDARVSNAHFRERAEGNRLAFDYRLRPGPCPTTNALVIMQRAGLPVTGPLAEGPTAETPEASGGAS